MIKVTLTGTDAVDYLDYKDLISAIKHGDVELHSEATCNAVEDETIEDEVAADEIAAQEEREAEIAQTVVLDDEEPEEEEEDDIQPADPLKFSSGLRWTSKENADLAKALRPRSFGSKPTPTIEYLCNILPTRSEAAIRTRIDKIGFRIINGVVTPKPSKAK